MRSATVRLYAELGEFVPPEKRQRPFRVPLFGPCTVEEVLTIAGVPAEKVDLVLLNGISVSLTSTVRAGDRLGVYPVFESFDITPLQRVRARPLRTPRFILDVHLGKLATILRLLGFDTLYRSDYTDDQLVVIAGRDERALLSRDRELLSRPEVTRGYRVQAIDPEDQARETIRRFDLRGSVQPFQRCLSCNALLEHAEKANILPLLPPRVRESQTEFLQCPACRKVFWQGSHYARMKELVDKLLASAAQ